MKNVLLLTTGGTIASRPGSDGLVPEESPPELMQAVAGLRRHYRIDCRSILSLDSSNIQAEEWQLIARSVYDALPSYDGIVITHGTDTMAYTASMLSFMLVNLDKPVVLTGSQLPISSPLSDAPGNLATAFAAVQEGIPGVSIAFDHKILNGCRAVKVRTMGFDAFESVNAPNEGEVLANGLHLYRRSHSPYTQPCVLKDRICNDVFLLKLIPGTPAAVLEFMLDRFDGLVIESFGVGGLPEYEGDASYFDIIHRGIARGKLVVMTTQVPNEGSNLAVYHVGGRLKSALRLLEAYDMTTEAAVAKLMWIMGQTRDFDEAERLFYRPVARDILYEN